MARKLKRNMPAVKYNAGNSLWYRREITRLIRAMNSDVRDRVISIVSEHAIAQPEMANDANPVQFLKDALRDLSAKWIGRFINRALPLSTEMTDRTTKSADRQLEAAAGREGFAINMQMSEAMDQRVDAIIAENVSLIRSIPEKYFTQVEGMVYRAVARGGDRKKLTDEIMEKFSDREGKTRRRAEFIARDQVRKATSALSAVRQQAAGITEGVWVHSAGQANPRHKHVQANGKTFKLSEGFPCGPNNEHVMPGEEPNCSCSWKPKVPW